MIDLVEVVMKNNFLNKFRSEKGSVTILVSLIMLTLMVSMAIAIDVGVVYTEKAKLSKAIDAAILAGGVELPNNKNKAKAIMEEYLIVNGVSLEQATISIAENGLSAEIVGIKEVPYYFAKILGYTTTDIEERTKVVLGAAGSVKGGIRPFGLTKFDFEYGDLVTLKEGAGDSYHGNFGAISLGSTGTAMLLSNALYGYDGELNIGDHILTEPGNMAGMVDTLSYYINSIDDTFDNYNRNSDRVWTVPVFDTMELDGRGGVVIVGFAQIFVADIHKAQGNAEVYARFIEYVTNGEINTEIVSTGVYGIKLVD